MQIPVRKLTADDRSRIHALRDEEQNFLTATSELSLLPWRDYFGFSLYDGGSFLLVFSEKKQGFLYPYGNAQQAFDYLESAYRGQRKPRFIYLSRSQAETMQKRGYTVTEERDAGEYIYESRALALRGDNISKNFRRKCRSFEKNESCSVSILQPEQLPYFTERLSGPAAARDDLPAVLDMLRSYEDYGLYGLCIRSGEKWAVIAGYRDTRDIFTMSLVEYSDDFGSAVVPVCIRELAERVCDRYRYINLEEDLGLEGLRRMKMLYKPAFILEAFTADDSTPEAENQKGTLFLQ